MFPPSWRKQNSLNFMPPNLLLTWPHTILSSFSLITTWKVSSRCRRWLLRSWALLSSLGTLISESISTQWGRHAPCKAAILDLCFIELVWAWDSPHGLIAGEKPIQAQPWLWNGPPTCIFAGVFSPAQQPLLINQPLYLVDIQLSHDEPTELLASLCPLNVRQERVFQSLQDSLEEDEATLILNAVMGRGD